MTHSCGLGPEDLGPYLLGGLAVAEQRSVEQRLADCPECAGDVAELRPVLATMAAAARTVELDPAPDAPPGPASAPVDPTAPDQLPAAALDRMLAAVRAERPTGGRSAVRPWQRPVIVAAATVVVACLVTAGVALIRPDDGRRLTLTGSGGVAASARLVERSWGTALRLDARGLRPGVVYGAWLAYPDGRRLAAGTFVAGSDGTARVDLASGLPLAQAATVGVTALGGDDVMAATIS